MTLIFFTGIFFAAASSLFLVLSLPRLACWVYAFKKQQKLINTKNNKLAVLIPARNESMSVGKLFEDIAAQDYPRECFDVHVIVSDPSDPTVKMAEDYGFLPLAVTTQTCKSDALDACMQEILAENPYKYDAYIIVDADCGLDKSFLSEMNNALASGADIICSKKIVKNYFYGTQKECPMSACCNGIIWTLIDNMGNKFKSAKGYPCFTVGTGLMLTARVVREKNGWPYKSTLTEDVELMHEAAIDHRKFFYYEHALLYMEEAQKLSVTNKRRRRWLTGVVQSERLYRKRASCSCSWGERYYTCALNYIYGFIGTAVLYSAVMAVLSLIFAILGNPAYKTALFLFPTGLATVYLSFFIMTLIAVMSDWQYIKLPLYRKIILLFVHPLFYMQYIYIVGKPLLFPKKKSDTWEVIDRVDFSDSH